jgi:TolA-binding protein
VRAPPSAVWSERVDGDREQIVLEHGELWIQIDHAREAGHAAPRRLVVLLPDGELEDTGTTFSVDAEGGRTARVAVIEGQVVLRLRGRAPVVITAGGAWAPDAASPLPAASFIGAAPTVALPIAATPPTASSRAPAPPGSSSGSASPDASGTLFRVSATALARGDACDAAASLGTFLEKYPGDARAEDAAYLRVVALQRCGDADAMKEAARAYLRRYPEGFRRAEIDALSR